MKIGIIAKYLPIQGGVSTAVFDFVYSLAEAGHQVELITNANEVEQTYQLNVEEPFNFNHLKGTVDVFNVENFHKNDNFHIPFSPLFESRLYGLALERHKIQSFDLLVAWYLFPYGIVAARLAKEFDIPSVFIHAGSDIVRLSKQKELKIIAKQYLPHFKYIISDISHHIWKHLEELGAKKSQLIQANKGRLLPFYFNDIANKIDINLLFNNGKIWWSKHPILSDYLNKKKSFNSQKITIGIYGKIGLAKGSFDALDIVEQLLKKGFEINLVCLPLGTKEILNSFFKRIVNSDLLYSNTYIIPPVAPWKIPALISNFDATFYLENGFDVDFHYSLIPLEIMASQSCLICSKEMADKLTIRKAMQSEINYIEIENPKNHNVFLNSMEQLLSNPNSIKNIARRGRETYEKVMDLNENINPYLKVLSSHVFPNINTNNKEFSLDYSKGSSLLFTSEFVVAAFMRDYKVSYEEAKDIFSETIKWIYLGQLETKAKRGFNLSIFGGTYIIDEMWHTFILCTEEYHSFCLQYFKRYIHHRPIINTSENKINEQKFLEECKQMMSYVYDHLGEETAIKWYKTYAKKYSLEKIQKLKK